jgi:hypothetical protein
VINQRAGRILVAVILGVAVAFLAAAAAFFGLRFSTGRKDYDAAASVCIIGTGLLVSAASLLWHRLNREQALLDIQKSK